MLNCLLKPKSAHGIIAGQHSKLDRLQPIPCPGQLAMAGNLSRLWPGLTAVQGNQNLGHPLVQALFCQGGEMTINHLTHQVMGKIKASRGRFNQKLAFQEEGQGWQRIISSNSIQKLHRKVTPNNRHNV